MAKQIEMAPKRYLTTREAAVYLRLSPQALRSMRYRGDAPAAARVGRGLLWTQEVLDAWVEERTTARPEALS